MDSIITMNNNPVKISVVVPCYKVERYLEECVNSILASTFKDFEIILVDDGSPDKSGEIADELATHDSRIHVIHQKNGGVTQARKTGFEVSQGEWITFVDSDDTITPNALEVMYKATLDNNTDIVIGFPVGKEFPEVPVDYSIEQYRADSVSGFRISVVLWGRLIRRSIITPLMFVIPREVKVGEDMLFCIRCAFATDKNPVVLKKYVYSYNIHEGSAIQSFKRTPEYEQSFHQYRLVSIPENKRNKYMNAIIADRFHPVQWWSFHNPLDTSWMESEFIKNLKEDIQTYSYHLKFRERVMLCYKNTLVRMVMIPTFRIVDALKRL